MGEVFRALTLGALLAATAVAAQTPTQHMRFTGDDKVFSAVATATATVSADDSFLRVRLEEGTIRSTSVAKGPVTITGFRIGLAHSDESGNWEIIRKSDRVPLDFELGHLETIPVPALPLKIPIDGVGSLNRMWLIFEIDVDGTPPGFTYSHGEKLKVGH